jgi:hypothetical protein
MLMTIGGVIYKIAVVASTSSLTLTKPYAGTTSGSVAATVVQDGADPQDRVLEWGYNQAGDGSFDKPALQFAYHWALESNWCRQDTHDATFERHQAITLGGFNGATVEKRTDYGQGWKTGYDFPPGYFLDTHQKDHEVFQQAFVVDTTSVAVDATGHIVTISVSNPNVSQIVSVGATFITTAPFINATFLNGLSTYPMVQSVLSDGFTMYLASGGTPNYGPTADYVSVNMVLNYMDLRPASLCHVGSITAGQDQPPTESTLTGTIGGAALVILGVNGSTGPISSGAVTTSFDISGGAKPACGVGTNWGIGSTYIDANGHKWDCSGASLSSSGTWLPTGTFAVNNIGGSPGQGSGFYTNSYQYFGDVTQRPGNFGGGTMFCSSWTDDQDKAGLYISSINGGATLHCLAANVGTPATPLTAVLMGGRSGIALTIYDGGSAALTFDGSQNGTFANKVTLPGTVMTAAAPTVSANQVSLGGTVASSANTTGGGLTLPLLAAGYLVINVAGTTYKVPYYAS